MCWGFYLLVLCKHYYNELWVILVNATKIYFDPESTPFYHHMFCVCQYNKDIIMSYSKHIPDTSMVAPHNLHGYPWTLITKVYLYIRLNDNTYWDLNITQGWILQFRRWDSGILPCIYSTWSDSSSIIMRRLCVDNWMSTWPYAAMWGQG